MKVTKWLFMAIVSIVMSACGSSTKAPEAVDLGLSTKWASFNLGSDAPENLGDVFAWGEIKTKDSYSAGNSETYEVEEGNLDATKDAASALLGDGWRMPTEKEFKELISKCNWKWSRENGKRGYKITGPNGNSIFLPVSDDTMNAEGNYWSSTVDSDGSDYYARALRFTKERKVTTYHDRFLGFPIRPVKQ